MIKQYLLSPTCLKCGSFMCNDSLFCIDCFKKEILSRYKNNGPSHLGEHHFYLIGWIKNESDVLSQMIYHLKSDNAKLAWSYYARFVVKKLKRKIDFSRFDCVVPIPGSKAGSVHAQIFAKQISQLSGLPMKDILIKRSENSEQKARNLAQRRMAGNIERKHQVFEQFTKCLFVDDVVTTGESFYQSCKALKADPQSAIISLFYRLKQDGFS